MVVGTSIYKAKEDKQKLTEYDPEKGDFEPVYAPHVITRETERSRLFLRILYFATLLTFGLFLIYSGLLIYKRYHKQNNFNGYCKVHYYRPHEVGHLIDRGGLYADDLVDKPIFNPKEQESNEDDDNDDFNNESGEFIERISLNLTNDFEQIEVPEVSIYKKASFVHDFSSNWSVIHDLDSNKCFILPLDRSKIAPPKNLFDMIMKSMTGYYLPDNALMREEMIVQTPELDDLTQFGSNIAYKCKDSQSYLLKKRQLIGENHSIDRRSLIREKRCEFASDFIHSVGKATLAYHLTC